MKIKKFLEHSNTDILELLKNYTSSITPNNYPDFTDKECYDLVIVGMDNLRKVIKILSKLNIEYDYDDEVQNDNHYILIALEK